MRINDSKGREWAPAVNGLAIREYENFAGVRVFEVLCEFFVSLEAGEDGKRRVRAADMVRLFPKLFPRIQDFLMFAFLCCRDQTKDRGVGFEDFVESIGPAEVLKALSEFADEGSPKSGEPRMTEEAVADKIRELLALVGGEAVPDAGA